MTSNVSIKCTGAVFVTLFMLNTTSFAESSNSQPVSVPGITTIEASVRKAPPPWALMQRHLIETMNEAAPLYLKETTYRGGSLREHGKLDDDYECFDKWALLYAIGGDDQLLEWALREFNAITRYYAYERNFVHEEFVTQYDMLHLSEGYLGFQYLGLGDPSILENIDRARRFAGYYLNEDPEAQNYDPQYKIIRSIATGSKGPAETMDGTYMIDYGHVSLYPFVKELEWDWSKNPKQRAEYLKLFDRIAVRCDVPMNLSVTGLVANAYLYTSDDKYKRWIEEYVGAWMDRIKENNGILPDNIGRTGKIGEYRNGKWWGGFFGWSGRYSLHMIFMGLLSAMESSLLLTGDPTYIDLVRSQVDVLLANSVTRDGQLLIPYKYGPKGWEDYRPMEPFILSHLWHASMDPEDWERIERVRAGSKFGPFPYQKALGPGRPKPGSESWESDGTSVDWKNVVTTIDHQVRQHQNEAPHLLYLAGENPGWPEKILETEYGYVYRALERLRNESWRDEWDVLTMTQKNPVYTNGLIQMTMGAPWVIFNGGLLMARVRYFDTDRARPGLPEDVAALVEKIETDRTVVHLVNLNAFETRNLIVQAGAYREHKFIEVKYDALVNDSSGKKVCTENSVPVNKEFFAVELPPATSIKFDIKTQRFVNKPTFAFPWYKTNK